MRTYQQLTREQRYQIYALRQAGHSQSQVARAVGVHKSTISRELRRNGAHRGYLPRHAHLLALFRRRAKARRRCFSAQHWAVITALIRRDWSPEQIAGRLAKEGAFRISHEWIYQYLLADRRSGGCLYRHLRCQKQRRKRYGKPRRVRGGIIGRVGINQRPSIVARRRRLGDWEGDTLCGHGWSTGIVTLVERKSRYTVLGRLQNKSAHHTGRVLTRCLRPYQSRVHTLTVDNGQEFASHRDIMKQLNTRVFFADSYAPWQRGTIENINGLLRQYFPKGADFTTLTQKEIRLAEQRLNHRPKKCLGFKTPFEVFFNTNTQLTVALNS
ncbi:MAG: IS30 family transposase [Burkholderiales bacterium]